MNLLQELEQAREENRQLKEQRLNALIGLERRSKAAMKEIYRIRDSIAWWRSRELIVYADELVMLLKDKVDNAYKHGLMSEKGYKRAYEEYKQWRS
jgi:hypothetical protein